MGALLIERTTKPVMQSLKDAKMEPSKIDKVILVGGPTRMPIVQRYVEQLLGKKIERGVDPMEAVAFGAHSLPTHTAVPPAPPVPAVEQRQSQSSSPVAVRFWYI